MDVTAALEAHKTKFKPTTVEKDVPVDLDLHHMAAFDNNALDEKKLKSSARDAYLLEVARDATQVLVNEIFALPTSSTDEGVMAELPKAPTTVLPREKPIPKPKEKTRWEAFAEAKGIKKRTKRDRMVLDEETEEYKPRWGYGRARAEGGDERDWLIEVPADADPMEDQFAKSRADKKERVEKNRKRQRRNEEEAVAKAAKSAAARAKRPRQARR
ncbi:MAG: ribosome biogenesis regulatory protein-domain-containing protein [Olpidium bornovanus]|uniref:Ribosome biogenesis regulatory protein n=1 Tax=Olpidium bornovanus TaxID=278681 RepID=A0A8H7ZR54_9FUNG|nr:MAG: ribosome biogenesis regulatory protein-domain-containing protein [Olpidium bornovanus]